MQISVGCVRARFAKHIAVLILIDACASAIGYYLFGFAFSFGDGYDANGALTGAAVPCAGHFCSTAPIASHQLDAAQAAGQDMRTVVPNGCQPSSGPVCCLPQVTSSSAPTTLR